jgi:acetoin utilization deacetylase AcuC-like enzyme
MSSRSVWLLTDASMDAHHSHGHPERPERRDAVVAGVRDASGSDVMEVACEAAPEEDIVAIHDPGYLDRLHDTDRRGGWLDPDTYVAPGSLDAALLAAGATRQAALAVAEGQAEIAFAAVRPPGHHAAASRSSGFCLLNNVAIAAAHARQHHGLDRVLIVDWDIHHGNGTQDLFYSDGQVVFFSSHRFPFWPGTGASDETGAGAGLGATFNLPVTYGTTPADFRKAFEGKLVNAVRRAKPQLILLSAGFDAHRDDPIGDLGLGNEDFELLTRLVCDVADRECGGKLVSLLEGGYNVDRLAECVDLHAEGLSR